MGAVAPDSQERPNNDPAAVAEAAAIVKRARVKGLIPGPISDDPQEDKVIKRDLRRAHRQQRRNYEPTSEERQALQAAATIVDAARAKGVIP